MDTTYLQKLNGEDVSLPTPISRQDKYLAKMCGMDVVVEQPVTRTDQYLFDLSEKEPGSGGGTQEIKYESIQIDNLLLAGTDPSKVFESLTPTQLEVISTAYVCTIEEAHISYETVETITCEKIQSPSEGE